MRSLRVEQYNWTELLAILGAAAFFATDLNKAVFIRLFTLLGMSNPSALLLSAFIPLLLALPLLLRKPKWLCASALIIGLVGVYFFASLNVRPELYYYFFRPRHGIQRVFRPESGLYAFYFLFALGSMRLILPSLKLAAVGSFAFRLLQFAKARIVGYWIYENQFGVMKKINYSLDFGFGMALIVCLFIYFYTQEGRKYYLIAAAVGFITMVFGGNRMSLALPLGYLILLGFTYGFDRARATGQWAKFIKNLLLCALVVIICAFAFYGFAHFVVDYKLAPLNHSRNLRMIAKGTFGSDSHRQVIHQLVREGLAGHWITGLGAYGDRPLIVSHYIWGYSHNFFYEVFSNLGLLLGVPLITALAWGLLKNFTSCATQYDRLNLLFIAMSVLHLTSLSFWSSPYIWSILALLILSYGYKYER